MNAVPGPAELKVLIRLDSRVETQRSLYCGSYNSCLDEAVQKGWTSWTCARCPMFDREPEGDGSTIREERPALQLATSAKRIGGARP